MILTTMPKLPSVDEKANRIGKDLDTRPCRIWIGRALEANTAVNIMLDRNIQGGESFLLGGCATNLFIKHPEDARAFILALSMRGLTSLLCGELAPLEDFNTPSPPAALSTTLADIQRHVTEMSISEWIKAVKEHGESVKLEVCSWMTPGAMVLTARSIELGDTRQVEGIKQALDRLKVPYEDLTERR